MVIVVGNRENPRKLGRKNKPVNKTIQGTEQVSEPWHNRARCRKAGWRGNFRLGKKVVCVRAWLVDRAGQGIVVCGRVEGVVYLWFSVCGRAEERLCCDNLRCSSPFYSPPTPPKHVRATCFQVRPTPRGWHSLKLLSPATPTPPPAC